MQIVFQTWNSDPFSTFENNQVTRFPPANLSDKPKDMSLVVQNLSVTRANLRILHEVSLSCQPEEAIILRGPNGVGKTTFLRTLAGFIPASGGDATLNGDHMANRDDFQSHLTYAGHADAIKAQMTVGENLRFWADLHGSQNSEDVMEAFDLNRIQHRLAGKCSAGQKRRLGLARLLVANRNLWLLDEPTVSLDQAARDSVAEAIKAHLAGGGMAVIATHDTDLVAGTTVTMTPAPQLAEDDTYWTGGAT